MFGVSGFISEYQSSFILGFVFIAIFAWDRLNQADPAGPGTADSRSRFFQFLAPSKLLRTAVLLRGWSVYVLLLGVLYTLLCFVGQPVIEVIIAPYVKETGFGDIVATSPSFPLIVSLITIGLLPRFPLLASFEEVSRRAAYRVIGIPDAFMELADALYVTELDPAELDPATREKIDLQVETAVAALQGSNEKAILRSLCTKLYFWKAELANGQPWPGSAVVQRFESPWRRR